VYLFVGCEMCVMLPSCISVLGSSCGGRGVWEEYSLDSPTSFVECPICTEMFPMESIEVHAAVCVEMSSSVH
jgi:hypothetical protein